MYEGMSDLLSGLVAHLYVVTARDSASTRDLLSSHGIDLACDHIYGEQQSKLAALADIQGREGVETERGYFIDDSLSNLLNAGEAGHSVGWAIWGYSAPEHRNKAIRLGVPQLALSNLLAPASAVNPTSAMSVCEENRNAYSNADGGCLRP